MASLVWTQKQNMGPSPRAFHDMVFYPASGKFILFGGGNPPSGETWEWDGEWWCQVADTGPSARSGHVMAYDSVSKCVLLFGGSSQTGAMLGDTWAWDGTWLQVADSGPEPVVGPAMTDDPVRKRVVLFGGMTTGSRFVGNTWEWNGGLWTQVDNSGPSARNGARLAYDATAALEVLFGGDLVDPATWGWDGLRWRQLADMGPSKRGGHAMCSTKDGVLLFGGQLYDAPPIGVTGIMLKDTWLCAQGKWRQIQDMGPAPRWGHAMAPDSAGNIVIFGGEAASTPFGDTWQLVERN